MKNSLRKMLSIVTALVMMALSTLPSVSSAEELLLLFSLGGTLQISGPVAVGSPLLPDYSLATPIGLTDQDLDFLWVREALETDGFRYTISHEPSYIPTEADEGYTLSLTVTGRPEKGVKGELVAIVGPVGPRIADPEVLDLSEAAVDELYIPMGNSDWESASAPQDPFTSEEDRLVSDEIIQEPPVLPQEESGAQVVSANEDILVIEEGDSFQPTVSVPTETQVDTLDLSEVVLDFGSSETSEAMILYDEPVLMYEPPEVVPDDLYEELQLLVDDEEPLRTEEGPLILDEASAALDEGPRVAGERLAVEEKEELLEDPKEGIIVYEDEEESLSEWDMMSAVVTLDQYPVLEEDDAIVSSEIESMVYDDFYRFDESDYILPGTIYTGERVLTMDSVAEEGGGSFTLAPETVDFGSLISGYNPDDVTPAMITVTNTGSSSIAFDEPWSDLGNLEIIVTETIVLEPGQSTMVPIRPLGSLVTGTYEDSVVFTPTNQLIGAKAVNVTFTVVSNAAETYELEGIYPLDHVSGIANGSDKTAAGLGLPTTVRIGTNVDDMDAEVSWDVANCAYDPASTEAQSFNVTGNLILPSNVVNPGGISTEVSISVDVNAGTPVRQPYVANPENNKITGLESGGQYTTDTKLSFAAVGDGMDNTSPMAGDTRYRPFSWIVLENKEFSSPPYEVTFRMQKAGEYNLSVNFQEESYDGAGWAATNAPQDTKTITFSIVGANGEVPVVTTTPAPSVASAVNQNPAIALSVTPTPSGAVYQGGASYTTGATYQGGTSPVGIANAVQTGDTSPIVTFVIILLVTGVFMGVVVIIILKRKKR